LLLVVCFRLGLLPFFDCIMSALGCFALCVLCVAAVVSDTVPQQLRLSLTGNPTEMVVMWITNDDTATTTVKYQLATGGAISVVTGTTSYYDWPLPPYESGQIHTATMTGLAANTRYMYMCGDPQGGWSAPSYFVTENTVLPTPSSPLRIAHVGDQGTTVDSVNVTEGLLRTHQQTPYNFLMHSGDISYANGIQKYWDVWGNMVVQFSSQVPWMVAVGNHEIIDAFIAYDYRFTMPAKQSGATFGNLYYSFNYRGVHVVALSSEMPEYWHWGLQYTWLQHDLANVNRKTTPWIFAYWHSPWYNANQAHQGDGDSMKSSFEDLLYQYRVDLCLQGHVHAYERNLPVYANKLNANGPVYITNGVAGTNEGLYDKWISPLPAWSAYRGAFWGYGTITIFNSTNLLWEMRRANDSVLMDSYSLVRQR